MKIRDSVRAVVAVCGMAAAVLVAGAAEAQQCMRWNANVNPCHVLQGTANCAPLNTFSFGQQRLYWTQWELTKDGPGAELIACQKHWDSQGYPGPDAYIQGGYCKKDCTANSPIAGLQACTPGVPLVYNRPSFSNKQRESQCDLVPNGPYSSLGTSGTSGAAFTSTQKNDIRTNNFTYYGGNISPTAGARHSTSSS